jgi:hypothetical protein
MYTQDNFSAAEEAFERQREIDCENAMFADEDDD